MDDIYYLTKEEYCDMMSRFSGLLYENKCTVDAVKEEGGYAVRVSEGIDLDFYNDVYLDVKWKWLEEEFMRLIKEDDICA